MTIKVIDKRKKKVDPIMTAIYRELLKQDLDKLTLAPHYKIVFEDDLK